MSMLEIDCRSGTAFRGAILLILALSSITVAAQSPAPLSWGTAPAPSAAPQPHAVPLTGPRQAAISVIGAPPVPRDCSKVVTQANPDYRLRYGWSPVHVPDKEGTIDGPLVIDTVHKVDDGEHNDHSDLQVRIEQFRCQNQNIEAKLDYIIRKLAQ